jgi:hypothetical protein
MGLADVIEKIIYEHTVGGGSAGLVVDGVPEVAAAVAAALTDTRRSYGRDGNTYGRHVLTAPGGDNVQRDVFHILGAPGNTQFRGRLHPTRIREGYVGAHRNMSR